jgi:putative ABC transport system substrate-binding protein
MRRREFLRHLAGAAAVPALLSPHIARAQPASLPVVGYLGSESPGLSATRLRAFREGLAAAGYVEGKDVAIDYRWAEGRNDRLSALAAELVNAKVTVLAAPGSLAAALAAKAATSAIPIIFEMGADPVSVGLVASMNRPGGNITGVSSLNAQIGPKRLELLHEVLPGATGFALMLNPSNPQNAENTLKGLQEAARALKLEIHVVTASTEGEFDAVFTKLPQLPVAGLVIANETFYAQRAAQLGALAQKHAVPAVHQSREFASAGGLMSYGGDTMESHRQAGVYTGRVLKGGKPAELPVQQVTKVHMAINLRAARALGLNVSPNLVARADEVIE